MRNLILAVVGLAGAGKTETTNYLLSKTGWPKVYFGQAVIDKAIEKYGLANESNERKVREELRQQHGMKALAVASLPKIIELYENSNVLVESLYSWEEYVLLKERFGDNFKVLAIYCSFLTRASRMKIRPTRPLTEQQLKSRDYSQIENLHQAGPIARADWTIVNEGSKGELYQNLEKILKVVR